MKFLALFPAKFSDLIDRTLKITQNTRRRGRSLRQCAQFRVFCSAACKTCACCGQMCGLGGRFFRPAARRDGFLQEAEEKAAEKGSPPRGRFPLSGGNVPKGQKGSGCWREAPERLLQIRHKTQTANSACGLERKKRAQRKTDVACGGSFRRGHF